MGSREGGSGDQATRGSAEPGDLAPPTLHWWGTLLYVPVLYGLGWLASRPLGLLVPGWRPDQVDLAGAALALLLLLLSLPWRLRRTWGCTTPWRRLGVRVSAADGVRAFLRGVLQAALLLAGVCTVLLLSGQARWLGQLGMAQLLNGLALLLGVGFAEELLFRGWLWGELQLLAGERRAMGLQAACFALVHPWYRLPALEGTGLLIGLVLLALVLASQRRADRGSLWGSVGLHGGLVGGWFAIQAGLMEMAQPTAGWLVGPGGNTPNPIGGVLGWIGLSSLLGALSRHRAQGSR